jgi:hypothetical protein
LKCLHGGRGQALALWGSDAMRLFTLLEIGTRALKVRRLPLTRGTDDVCPELSSKALLPQHEQR